MEDSQCSTSLKHLGVCTTEKQLCVYVNTHTHTGLLAQSKRDG